ncbi:ABC transporter ATP-binding protein [Crocinitomix catalasitica]|nr:ABC transporter ATP-binding protein [Crocinitomix catalasitica]
MLNCKNIVLSAGSKQLFKLKDLSLETGLVALVGRNGSGKSTFLRSILNDHDNYEGSISLNGKAVKDYAKSELAKIISVVYTRAEVFGNHTVADVLILGRIPQQGLFSRNSKKDRELVSKVMEQLDLTSLKNSAYHSLSDGEKQLVMIGRALVQDSSVILMDEPAAFLDLVNRVKLIQILKEISQTSGKLIIFSTHHIDILDQYCDRLLLIADKELKNLEFNFEQSIRQSFGI